MSRSNKKIVSIVIKIVILALASYFIYTKLHHNPNISNFKALAKYIPAQQVWIVLVTVFGLMLLNWFLEALKWKFLVSKLEKISAWKAIESIFCGLTWAVFTPNRLGEFGGRVLFLSPRKRISGTIAMSVGAIGQLVVTNILGSLAVLWFVNRFLNLNIIVFFCLIVLVIIFCLFFLLFFFNIKWVGSLLLRIPFLKKFKKFFRILGQYKKKELLRVFIYSLSRFTVFTTQYCLLINLLAPGISLLDMTMMLCIMFFVQSSLPSLDLLDVGVRASTATYLFAFITPQEVAIMASTASIWLINLIIPAILGCFFVLKLNFFGKYRS
ncbi:MAG: lysylphosphatidylglycerol synthase domain-containing protein [Daejeonella sp.]